MSAYVRYAGGIFRGLFILLPFDMAATVTHKFVSVEKKKPKKKYVIGHEGGEKPSHRHSTCTNLLQYTGPKSH